MPPVPRSSGGLRGLLPLSEVAVQLRAERPRPVHFRVAVIMGVELLEFERAAQAAAQLQTAGGFAFLRYFLLLNKSALFVR